VSVHYPTSPIIVYDLEVFPGFFLAGFEFPDGTVTQFCIMTGSDTVVSDKEVSRLKGFLQWITGEGYFLASFNGSGYDDLILTAFLDDPTPAVAYDMSVDIIVRQKPRYQLPNEITSIDLMQILPGRIGLKKIGVCLGHSRLQELPIAYHKVPTEAERKILLEYNRNDLEITRKLLDAVQPELDLRATMSERYHVDLRSRGEATMAEMAIMAEYRERGGQKTKKEFNQEARARMGLEPTVTVSKPSWWGHIEARPDQLGKLLGLGKSIFDRPIPVVSDYLAKGVLDRQVFLADRYYKMGVGGLHSIDGPGCWIPDTEAGESLVDIDVASYYPNIILTQGLAPRQWGDQFLPIYRGIVDRRMKAKREGDKVTADILKISANGTYGKTSDPFSCLYDPQMTANVTVIGQLALLTLIAMLDGTADVVSANTDGISVLMRDTNSAADVADAVRLWESWTGFEMEYTPYNSLHQSDVNNYIAVTADLGKVKTKGRFNCTWPDLRHTPNAGIVPMAIQALIVHGTPIEETIYECRDINRFILTQSVSSGWATEWHGKPLGKMLRFYKSNRADAAPITRSPMEESIKGHAGNVPQSECCVPLEDLPDAFPEDMSYVWYVAEAQKLWDSISVPKTRGMNRLAELMTNVGLRPCYVDPEAKTYSRAEVKYGETDFSSRPPGWVMGTGTGGGLLAQVSDDRTSIMRVGRPYPSRTRKTIQNQYGFTLLYGARVPLPGMFGFSVTQLDLAEERALDWYYTPAELKKVGR